MTENLVEKLVKGKFIVTVLALIFLFVLCATGHMSGGECGLAVTAVVTAFLHFDGKEADAKP